MVGTRCTVGIELDTSGDLVTVDPPIRVGQAVGLDGLPACAKETAIPLLEPPDEQDIPAQQPGPIGQVLQLGEGLGPGHVAIRAFRPVLPDVERLFLPRLGLGLRQTKPGMVDFRANHVPGPDHIDHLGRDRALSQRVIADQVT